MSESDNKKLDNIIRLLEGMLADLAPWYTVTDYSTKSLPPMSNQHPQ
jgi:hypothetical protein